MGLPFLNPYLGKNRSFDHGVNFAVAGATAMDPADQFNGSSASLPFTVNSLKLQLRWFKDFMKSSFATDQGNSSTSLLKTFYPSINAHSVSEQLKDCVKLCVCRDTQEAAIFACHGRGDRRK
jgi:hypothetical protein